MRILQIIQRNQLRGAEIFSCQLGTELMQLGVVVEYVCLFDGASGLTEKFPRLSIRFLHANPSRRFWDFSAYSRLADIIAKGEYDVVQANAGDTLKYAALSRLFHRWRTPLIYRNANQMSSFIQGFLHLKLNQWFLSFCDWFVSVSEICRHDLIKIYSGADERSTTITIGTYSFDDVQPIDRDVPRDEPVFINIGSLVPEKNHVYLVRLFHEFYRRKMKGYLWIVGDGRTRAELEDEVRRSGLTDRIRMWGYRADPVSILKASDLMVMPSKIEGMPGVLLEALSCSVPVIASRVGGVEEIIHHGRTGYCLEGEDFNLWLKHMEYLTEDKTIASTFGVAGRELVISCFLMPAIAEKFLAVYLHLTSIRS